jgi:hypothetical protein
VQKDADTPDKPDNYPHFDAGIGFDASVADSPIGVWTHLAVTHDGATARLYMNGSLVTSRSFVAAFRPDTAKVVICGNQNDASGAIQERWNGLVDDVRLYNRALSSTEIAGLTQ